MNEKDALDLILTETLKRRTRASCGPCPCEEELAGYIDGALEGDDKERVEEHLSLCGDCLFMVVEARRALSGGFVQAGAALKAMHKDAWQKRRKGVFEVVVRFVGDVLELVRTTGVPTGDLAVAASRAEFYNRRKLISLQKFFDGLLIELDVEKTGPEMVEVSLWARDSKDLIPYAGLRASLFQGSRERCSLVMENGSAAFEYLPAMSYIIKISDDGRLLGEVDLQVEGAGYV